MEISRTDAFSEFRYNAREARSHTAYGDSRTIHSSQLRESDAATPEVYHGDIDDDKGPIPGPSDYSYTDPAGMYRDTEPPWRHPDGNRPNMTNLDNSPAGYSDDSGDIAEVKNKSSTVGFPSSARELLPLWLPPEPTMTSVQSRRTSFDQDPEAVRVQGKGKGKAREESASPPVTLAVGHGKHKSFETRRSVGFTKDPVETVSRPVNNTECWALYNFEMHARKCTYCHDPYSVHRSHNRLCKYGHRLAGDVARQMYNGAGKVLSTKEEDNKLLQIEIPKGYIETSGLLRAIERSRRHKPRRPFVNIDRSRNVAPKIQSHSVSQESVVAEIEASQDEFSQSRTGVELDRPSKIELSNRSLGNGSLYEQDLVTRSTGQHDVLVCEPTAQDLREYRLSGYYRWQYAARQPRFHRG